MSVLFVGLWIVGAAPAAVLGEVVRAEDPRIRRLGRIAFALLLGIDLLVAAVVFSVGDSAASVHTTRSIWWLTAVLGGIPVALVSGRAVRRGYAGHRLVLAAATLTTAALYFAFPLGFVPAGQALTGLGRFEHAHHVLDVVVLLVPTLLLLANELRWKHEPGPEPEPDRRSLRARLVTTPRGGLIVGGVLLLTFVWTLGTNSSDALIGLGVVLAGSGLYLWQRHRAAVRSALRDLQPPG